MASQSNPIIWIVVPAAGIGSRMGTERPKQYLPLLGKTLLEVTLDTLLRLDNICGVILALNSSDDIWPNLPIASDPAIRTVIGGERRCDSVLSALDFIADMVGDNTDTVGYDKDAWVCVHDAARPCVSLEKIEALIKACVENDTGAILAAPVADTIKRVYGSRSFALPIVDSPLDLPLIDRTEDRETLWQAHTPQMFKLSELRNALRYCIENNLPVTDEASAIEQTGGRVHVVADRRDNIKVTMPEDLAWAEFILTHRTSR